MKRLLSYLVLPKEISEFERRYLARINRVALIFFACHLPVFVGVALLAGTSVVQALVLTPIVLLGPLLAYKLLRNPRHLSIVSGFTAMCMGGLLVHFGQGPMQIEMHFYFFALLALLAVFGNPLAVITAAITVALHHLVLWLVLPRSVFNYDASIWSVGVHALFVVLESVAACFLARSFFDNVIGLEKIVQRRTNEVSERNRDMRLVLDNVGQGFLTVNVDGSVAPERSASAATWLGPHLPGKKLWEYMAALNPESASWIELGWEAVLEDVLPLEVALDQMPKRLVSGRVVFALEYRPVMADGKLSKLLLVMSDVTAEVERERFERDRRDFLQVFERVMRDRTGFLEFFAEADHLVTMLLADRAAAREQRRFVHTLKGNCAMFGLSGISSLCHDLETRMLESGGALGAPEREQLSSAWASFANNLRTLLGPDSSSRVEVERTELSAVLTALHGSTRREEIALRMRGWQFEPADVRLRRIAEQARAIAGRLGKGPIDVTIEHNDIRLSPASWVEFWSAFAHAIRNAVDHGLESNDERAAAGKRPQGEIRLTTKLAGDGLTDLIVEISDDGRGIAWDLVRERARAAGIPCATEHDLVEALFRDGLTTRGEVSEFSGRGIGMGALRAVCESMGGTVSVTSGAGRGVCLRFEWKNVHDRLEALVLPSIAPQSPVRVPGEISEPLQ